MVKDGGVEPPDLGLLVTCMQNSKPNFYALVSNQLFQVKSHWHVG